MNTLFSWESYICWHEYMNCLMMQFLSCLSLKFRWIYSLLSSVTICTFIHRLINALRVKEREREKNDCLKVEYFIFIIESNDCQSMLNSLFNTHSFLSLELHSSVQLKSVSSTLSVLPVYRLLHTNESWKLIFFHLHRMRLSFNSRVF